MESKRNAAKAYVQEHLDELMPEMRAAVETLLDFSRMRKSNTSIKDI